MRGLIFTSVIWVLALVVVNPQGVKGFLRSGTLRISREEVAILLALLGTHTFASGSSADEVVNNPATLERLLRGGLSGLALVVVLPTLVDRMASWLPSIRWRSMTALTVYVGVAFGSVLFSIAQLVSFAKAFELATGLAIIWTIALGPGARAALRRAIEFVVGLEAALLVGASAGFFLIGRPFALTQSRPGFLFTETLGAPFSHSNALSASGSVVAAYALARFLTADERSERFKWIGVFGIGTVGVVLASGRQGVVMWLAAVAVLMLVHRRRLFFLLAGPAAAGLALVFSGDLVDLFTRGNAGNLSTLTGRTIAWQAAFEAWSDHMFTGYGFGAGGRFVAQSEAGVNLSHLHSGYFEALVGVGLLGVIPLMFVLIRNGVWATRRLLEGVHTEIAVLMIPLVLHTAVSNGFGGWLNADFLLFAAIAALTDWEGLKQRALEDAYTASSPP